MMLKAWGVPTSLPLLPPSPLLFPPCCLGPNPLWSVPLPSVSPTEAQRLPYYATYCPTRLLIHSMCTSHYLDIFITFIICLNVVTMSLEHYNQPTVSPGPGLSRTGGLGPQQDPGPGGRQEGLSSTPIWGPVPRKLMAWGARMREREMLLVPREQGGDIWAQC